MKQLPLKTKRIALFILFGLWAAYPRVYQFDFGSGAVSPGFTRVPAHALYSESKGFGFENPDDVQEIIRSKGSPLRKDFITGDKEIFFSILVPQGNYNATFYFGDPEGTSVTTVTAENQRLLMDRVTTTPTDTVKKIITVNKREVTSIDGTVTMNIKDRELGYYTWDKKLTLRFKGRNPAIAGIKLESANQPLQIFLCGNSTVVDQMGEGWASWGQMIPRFFKAGISVANYAESGLTSGDFLRMKRLDKIMADLKEGDYVFVEFGHNDQKKQAYVESYKSSLKNFYKTISANKAHPIFVTPTARLAEADALTSIGGLAQTMREIAQELQIPCIDLNKMTIILKNALGSDKTSVYKDASHFTPYGGLELAYCVANALKEMNNGISPFILDEVVPYSPLKPHPIDFLTKEKPVVSVANNQEFKLILQRERPCTMINRYLLAKGSNFYNTLGQTIKGWSARQN